MPTTFSDSRQPLSWQTSSSLAASASSPTTTTDNPQLTVFRQAFMNNSNMLPSFGSSDIHHQPSSTGEWLSVPKESSMSKHETCFQENASPTKSACSLQDGQTPRTGCEAPLSVTGTESVSSDGSRRVPEVEVTYRPKMSDANGEMTPGLDSASRLKVRHASKRLKKYQAKEEKLRHSTESKQKMLGALCVRRNLLLSEMVSTMQKVRDSRQRLDKQRTANKALMKRIDHLTSLDPKDSCADDTGAGSTPAGGQREGSCSDRNNSSGRDCETLCGDSDSSSSDPEGL